MKTEDRKPTRRTLSAARKAELEGLGRPLLLEEAAEYLRMARQTLYNRLYAQKTDPSVSAPKGFKGREGWKFEIPELKAWDRRS